MKNVVQPLDTVEQISATPQQTPVGSTISGVKGKVHKSIDLSLWQKYEDYIVLIPLPDSIFDKLEKYGDKAYGTYSRFSNLEERSKSMLINHLEKQYKKLLKREIDIKNKYSDTLIENLTTEELMRDSSTDEINKVNQVRTEYELLELLKSLFTGIPLEGRPSYGGPFSFENP